MELAVVPADDAEGIHHDEFEAEWESWWLRGAEPNAVGDTVGSGEEVSRTLFVPSSSGFLCRGEV